MKEKIVKRVALIMCALMLSLSVVNASVVPVYAAESSQTTMTKLIDMILTKTGIVANEGILNDIKDELFNLLLEEGDTVIQYHIDNNIEMTRDSLKDYWENEVNNATGTRQFLLRALLKQDLFIDTLYALYAPFMENVEELVIDETELLKGIGLFDIVKSGVYTIWSEFVELIRALFDKYAEEEADFYYISTIGPNELNPLWFDTKTAYENFKSFLAQSGRPMLLEICTSYAYQTFTFGEDSTSNISGYYELFVPTNGLLLVDYGSCNDALYKAYVYNNDWEYATFKSTDDKAWLDETYQYMTDSELDLLMIDNEEVYCEYDQAICKIGFSSGGDYRGKLGVVTSDGRKMKVFKDVATMKLYSVGNQPYYLNQTNDYSTTNDNSVTFDGTYYQNNSSSYSYDVVQQEIDNSTEINEETVNNIVNDSSTTIINNYYTSDAGGSGDGSGGSSGEGLAGLLDAIGSFLDFLLGLIGSVVSLLTTFLDSALTLIGSLGSLFGDFGALLGDMFVFIPQECIDAITAGITLLVFVMIYKALK